MKNFYIFISLILLSACIRGGINSPSLSPYPQVSLNATGVTLPPATGGSTFLASGSAPSWSAIISPTSVTYIAPRDTNTIGRTYETRQSMQDGGVIIKDAKGEFFITLKKEGCTEGTGGTLYPYVATVLVGADTLTGCALEKS